MPLPVFGPYHSAELHSSTDIKLLLQLENAGIKSALEHAMPRIPVMSCSSGACFAEQDSLSLIMAVVRDVLHEQLNCAVVLAGCATLALSHGGTKCLVIPFGPTHAGNSLVRTLQADTELEVLLRKAPFADKDRAAPHTGDHGSAMKGKLAIVGMAGRFPDAATHEKLWELLEKGLDVHREVPADRFHVDSHVDVTGKTMNTSHTPYGCWIENPGLFDPRFFNMSPREAYQTDPMQRMAITTAYEALEMSGYVPNRTRSTKLDRIGTFYGQTSDDWREINAAQEVDTYYITGGVRAFGPGRINYHFGFSGPSFSIDTACSSSMAAVQLACTSLWAKDCDTAIVGGLSCMTNSDIFAGLSRGQFLSKNGPCATFDNDADGYCRADGCGTVIIKRLEDALADKDNVLAVVLATATNHSADAVSITHPHGGTQEILYRNILDQAGVDPLDVDYVEMHGTGTQAGDATEMKSVTNVFAPRDRLRSKDQSLYLGSVKANVGHGEAASGITALIKVLMMLQKNTVPPHVGVKKTINRTFPNDLAERNVHIAFNGNAPLPRKADSPRRVFVNNFSAAGGNSGLLLEDSPKLADRKEDNRSQHIVTVTAKSKSAMINNAERLMKYIEQNPDVPLSDMSYTTTARRIQHNWRMSVVGHNVDQVKELIKTKLTTNITPIPQTTPKIAFALTGQGSHYPALGKELLDNSSMFRDTILEYNNIAIMHGFPAFMPLIDGTAVDVSILSPVVVQLGLLCFEMAMAKLWTSWGITPNVVIGHSLGEYAAMHVAGVLSASDAIYLIGSRAQLLMEKCTIGSHGMLAVKGDVASVKEALAMEASDTNIACTNGPAETVLSGKIARISEANAKLSAAGFKCTLLKLPFAFHSSQVDSILDDFQKLAGCVTFHSASIPLISTLLGRQLESGEIIDPLYLARHAREPVDFFGGLVTSQSRGLIDDKTIFLEVGPHPVCLGMVKSTFGTDTITVPSLRRIESTYKTVANSLSALHTAGMNIDWNEYHRDYLECVQLLDLPTYAFDEKNYWIQYTGDWSLNKNRVPATKKVLMIEDSTTPKLSTTTVHRVVQESVDADVVTVSIESDLARPDLRSAVMGHLVNGAGLCPSSIYADMAMTICEYGYKLAKPDAKDLGMNVANMEVIKPLIAKVDGSSQILKLTATIDTARNTAKLLFSSGSERATAEHAHCTVTFSEKAGWLTEWERTTYLIQSRIDWLQDAEKSGKASKIGRGLAYKLFAALVDYDPKYRGMEEVTLSSENMEATSKVSFQTKPTDGTFMCSPYWIDSVAHISGFIVNGSDAVDSKNQVYVSHGWESLRVAEPFSQEKTYRSYVKMQAAGGKMLAGDVYVFDGNRVIAVVGGLKFQCIPRVVLNQLLPPISGAAPVARPTPAIKPAPVKAAPVKKQKETSQVSKRNLMTVNKKLTTVTQQTMEILAREVGVGMDELVDNIAFTDLGVDSLMSLTASGRIREELEIEVHSSMFLDHPTIGQFKQALRQFETPQEPEMVRMATASTETSVGDSLTDHSTPSVDDSSPLSTPPSDEEVGMNKFDQLRETIRNTIAGEIGVDVQEVADASDLALLGVDSLMALSILGRLREETGLSLPADLFMTCPSTKQIEAKLNIGQSAPALAPKQVSAAPSSAPIKAPLPSIVLNPPTNTMTAAAPVKERFATSDLLQGKPRIATQQLWMVPDGSGSATSYTDIPDIALHLAVWGLNSPYMRTPEEYKCGVRGMATHFIKEIKRRQPEGPYMLSGWSAGGVIAFEIMNQLIKGGDEVSHLIIIDAPCPLIIEPLPASLHRWFGSIGMLGDGDPDELPSWLLPHFAASVAALSSYTADKIPEDKAPNVTAIWCEHGVCKEESDPRPDPYPYGHAQWLLENRTDFGPNSWDEYLPEHKIDCHHMPGNHFSMMGGELVSCHERTSDIQHKLTHNRRSS